MLLSCISWFKKCFKFRPQTLSEKPAFGVWPSSATAMSNEQALAVSPMPFAVPRCCTRGRAHSVRICFHAALHFQTGSQPKPCSWNSQTNADERRLSCESTRVRGVNLVCSQGHRIVSFHKSTSSNCLLRESAPSVSSADKINRIGSAQRHCSKHKHAVAPLAFHIASRAKKRLTASQSIRQLSP